MLVALGVASFVLAEALRRRLDVLRIDVTPDLALAFMAAAMLLTEESPQWGGDYRDALGALAILGFDLLGEGAE